MVPLSRGNGGNRVNADKARLTNPHWHLFVDWCQARGLPPLPAAPETVADFLATVPAAESTKLVRARVIRRVHREAGVSLPAPEVEPETCWRTGEGWLGLEETLRRIPIAGWKVGLTGRRDAYLVVLTGQLRLTREQARAVTAADITVLPDGGLAVLGRRVPYTDDPVPCPACAVRRWLKILAIFDDHGRGSARSYLFAYKRDEEHECATEESVAGLGEMLLLPSIDRYGWLSEWAPMSARTISAILAYRQDAANWPADAEPEDVDDDEVGESRVDRQHLNLAELAELQDVMEARATAALKHSDDVIADTMGLLERVRSH